MTQAPAPRMTRRLAAPVAVAAFALLLVAGLPWPCPVRLAFGVPCPSCGLTRAARAAATFDFHAATAFHPLWFVVLPALGAFLTLELGAYVWRGRALHLDQRPAVRRAFALVMVALVVVWIARFFGAFGGPVPV